MALAAVDAVEPGEARHVGLVVDSKRAARAALEQAGVAILPGPGIEFRDPWGNLIQVVEYSEIQFTKASSVLHGMGLDNLEKTPEAKQESKVEPKVEPEAEQKSEPRAEPKAEPKAEPNAEAKSEGSSGNGEAKPEGRLLPWEPAEVAAAPVESADSDSKDTTEPK